MSPLMFPDDPTQIDLPGEYRSLSDWGTALEARHARLLTITDQLNAWLPDGEHGPRSVAVAAQPGAVAEAYEVLWAAYEAEHAALNEAFLLVDVGFEVLAQLAEQQGVDLDEVDDEAGWSGGGQTGHA